MERGSRSKCVELELSSPGDHALERAFKVPSLRDVAERAPYMHAGQFSTRLSAQERRQIKGLLRSLSGGTQQ